MAMFNESANLQGDGFGVLLTSFFFGAGSFMLPYGAPYVPPRRRTRTLQDHFSAVAHYMNRACRQLEAEHPEVVAHAD